MSSTRVTRQLAAPRERVFRALSDPSQFPRWKVPQGMTCRVDSVDEQGFRVSLTYDAADRAGKSSAHTDTYRGRFVELVPHERVVEVDEFETSDPRFAGPMTITLTLREIPSGTELTSVHDGLPDGVDPALNELGWSQSLDRLAGLVERG